MARGIGFFVGFFIASPLYILGGYTLPFYGSAGIFILIIPLALYYLPRNKAFFIKG